MGNDDSQSLDEQLGSITNSLQNLPQISSSDLRNSDTRQALVRLVEQMATTNSGLTDSMSSAISELNDSANGSDGDSDDDGGLL